MIFGYDLKDGNNTFIGLAPNTHLEKRVTNKVDRY